MLVFRFQLYYYSNTYTNSRQETRIIVDNRGKTRNTPIVREEADPDEEETIDPIEKAIQSKYKWKEIFSLVSQVWKYFRWAGATIIWSNTKPYI